MKSTVTRETNLLFGMPKRISATCRENANVEGIGVIDTLGAVYTRAYWLPRNRGPFSFLNRKPDCAVDYTAAEPPTYPGNVGNSG